MLWVGEFWLLLTLDDFWLKGSAVYKSFVSLRDIYYYGLIVEYLLEQKDEPWI